MGEIESLSVDGVPAWFAPAPGPTYAGLLFRVGQADETLPTRGITHLVEHLALHRVGQEHHGSNGSVGSALTAFVTHGTPDEVATFLRRVTEALRALPLDRLPAEARILATEEDSAGGAVYASMLVYRYGARGYGLPAMPQLGPRRLTGAEVQAWSDAWFTTGNACLWIAGELPSGLSLDLPPGERRPPPEPEPIQRTPAWFVGGRAVAVSAVAPLDDPLRVAVPLAHQRVIDRLRHRDATSYSVFQDVDFFGSSTAYAFLAADTLPEHAQAVTDGMLAALGELAVEPPAREEVDAVHRRLRDAFAVPQARIGSADAAARTTLYARPHRDSETYLADLAAVTPEQVRAAIARLRGSLLVHVPPDTYVGDQRFEPVARSSETVLPGVDLPRVRALDAKAAAQRLAVSPQGVTAHFGPDTVITVAFAEAVAVQRWTDGARTVFAADGFRVFVHPGEWVNGAWAVEMVDWGVPRDRWVDMGEPAGSRYLEELARFDERVRAATPPPAPRRSRFSRG